MARLLWQWPEKKSRDPYERRRGKTPVTVVMRHRPGQHDPLAAREKVMIEAQEGQEAEEARARQEARDKQAAAGATTPDDPSDGEVLELYEEP